MNERYSTHTFSKFYPNTFHVHFLGRVASSFFSVISKSHHNEQDRKFYKKSSLDIITETNNRYNSVKITRNVSYVIKYK